MTRRGRSADAHARPSIPGWSRLPPLHRAFLRYVGRTRDPGAVPVMLLQDEVEDEIDAMTDRLFAAVEAALADAVADGTLDATGEVRFAYDTRLLLPAMITLGRIHVLADDVPLLRRWRTVDTDLVERGRDTTREIVRALLDGDMRDAINDAEFEDFETNARPRKRAAEIAQRRLREDVEAWLDHPDTPDAVGEHYRHAVRLSEGHQDRDRDFRDLLERFVGADDPRPLADEIRSRYEFADLQEPADLFAEERDLPYFATQYERVGVLYEDMLRMYEADLGRDLGEDFTRAVVLMVIAAQIGLDDTDDYPEDRGSQLTPVTAELNLHGAAGVDRLRRIAGTYLDRAERYSHDHLSGMAIEYIRQESLDRIDALAQARP